MIDQPNTGENGVIHNGVVSSSFTPSIGYAEILFVVINRICYVTLWNAYNPYTHKTQTVIATGLPRAKLNASITTNNGIFYKFNDSDQLVIEPSVIGSIFMSFSYVVDDDWKEIGTLESDN